MRAGGCVCGAVRYELSSDPYGAAICHCRTCQQAHGAPMVAWFSVRLVDFHMTGELDEYRSSDHAVRRFCTACGTHLLFDDSRYPDEIDVAATTLDDPEAFVPRFHIWTRSQRSWVKLADNLPRHPESSGQ